MSMRDVENERLPCGFPTQLTSPFKNKQKLAEEKSPQYVALLHLLKQDKPCAPVQTPNSLASQGIEIIES